MNKNLYVCHEEKLWHGHKEAYTVTYFIEVAEHLAEQVAATMRRQFPKVCIQEFAPIDGVRKPLSMVSSNA